MSSSSRLEVVVLIVLVDLSSAFDEADFIRMVWMVGLSQAFCLGGGEAMKPLF